MTWDDETDLIRAMISATVRYTTVTGTTSDGHDDSVEGEATFDTSEPARDLGVRRMYPAGFDSRPLAGTEAVVVSSRGGPTNGIMVGNGRRGSDPSIDSGEAVVYSPTEPTCKVWFDKNGKLHVAAKDGHDVAIDVTGAGNVAVNGGALKVARDTDPITVTGGSYTSSSLTLQIKDGLGATGTLPISVAAGALVVAPAGVAAASSFTMAGSISGGAANFKA